MPGNKLRNKSATLETKGSVSYPILSIKVLPGPVVTGPLARLHGENTGPEVPQISRRRSKPVVDEPGPIIGYAGQSSLVVVIKIELSIGFVYTKPRLVLQQILKSSQQNILHEFSLKKSYLAS